MLEHSDRGIREHLEALMPPGGGARRLVGWGVVAWAGIGGVILLWAASRLLSPVAGVFPYLVMAAMVVFVLNPAVRRLTGLGLPRRSAATIVFVAALGLTVLMLSLLVPVLIHQGQHFITSSPRLIEKGGGLFQRLSRSSNPLLHGIGSAGSTWIRDHAGSAPRALQTATDAGLKLAQAGLILIVGGFLGFLLLLSLPETTRGVAAMIPPAGRGRLAAPLAEVRRIVAGFVRARLIVSAAVGVVATIGLWAIHMPFWLLLGVIVGVANLIPMLGSWIGGIPVALVALVTKPPSYLLIVIPIIVLAHLIDGWILSPIVLRETTDLHPVVILLAVLVGAELLGFWGILAAIPVAGVVSFSVREWLVPRLTGMTPTAEPVHLGEPSTGAPG
ncbi:MAG TPA: AI-2E family transporter [Actinomycetota bacterium]|nr:AI-2E family transporter [Actinomycetota bacterium]